MLTKTDFKQTIAANIGRYPAIATLYLAGDPRIMQHLDATATMLTMFSSQLEGVMAEPFEKTSRYRYSTTSPRTCTPYAVIKSA